jgi:polygalacturonase
MDSCEVTNDAKLNHLVYIKTNERRGGYVKNIYVNNIKAGKISKGILGIDTDVLYFWRDLLPTYEKRLTSIKDIFLENIMSSDVEFISNISGQPELPIENVFLKNMHADTIREAKFINKNVVNFNEIE